MRKNEIGIGCAANTDFLYFHPGVHLVAQLPIRFDEVVTWQNVEEIIRGEFLTPPAREMVAEILSLDPIRDFTIRDLYFSLSLQGKSLDEEQSVRRWRALLPSIISTLRHATAQPNAEVVVMPGTPGVEVWHQDLLRELFG